MIKKTLTAMSDAEVEKIENSTIPEVQEKRNEQIKNSESKLKSKPKELDVKVYTVALPKQNERNLGIQFKFNGAKIQEDKIEELADEILKTAREGVINELKQSVVQEQKWLDKTRQ